MPADPICHGLRWCKCGAWGPWVHDPRFCNGRASRRYRGRLAMLQRGEVPS